MLSPGEGWAKVRDEIGNARNFMGIYIDKLGGYERGVLEKAVLRQRANAGTGRFNLKEPATVCIGSRTTLFSS